MDCNELGSNTSHGSPASESKNTWPACVVRAANQPMSTTMSGEVTTTISGELCTLYIANLECGVRSETLRELASFFGSVRACKVVTKKGANAAYAFVRYASQSDAEAALKALNGRQYQGRELRINWALTEEHKDGGAPLNHLFVGDLGFDVTDAVLYNAFAAVGTCIDARVMKDPGTGRSKGYGFVSFSRQEDAAAALEQMQGAIVGTRRVRLSSAQHKLDTDGALPDERSVSAASPHNTNIYVGNLAPEVHEDELVAHFVGCGPIAAARLHLLGGYGFIKFTTHAAAVNAIVQKHRTLLHKRNIKCSWGQTGRRTVQADGRGAAAAAAGGACDMGPSVGVPHCYAAMGKLPAASEWDMPMYRSRLAGAMPRGLASYMLGEEMHAVPTQSLQSLMQMLMQQQQQQALMPQQQQQQALMPQHQQQQQALLPLPRLPSSTPPTTDVRMLPQSAPLRGLGPTELSQLIHALSASGLQPISAPGSTAMPPAPWAVPQTSVAAAQRSQHMPPELAAMSANPQDGMLQPGLWQAHAGVGMGVPQPPAPVPYSGMGPGFDLGLHDSSHHSFR